MRAKLHGKTGRRGLIVGVVAVLAVGVMVVPSLAAPAKIYSLNMAVTGSTTSAGTVTQTITATFKNETPSGNSSINSLRLTAAADPSFQITAASVPSGQAQVSADGHTVSVSNMNPVNNGQSFVVSLTATAPDSTCAGVGWSAVTWTGSNFSGNNFTFQQSLSSTTTGLLSACTLRFVPSPASNPGNGLVNTNIPSASGGTIQVELVNGSASRQTWFNGSVTLSETTGPTATLSGNTATASSGVASFPSFKIDTTGDYTVTASSGGLSSSASPQFTIYGDGINCQGTSGPVTGGGTTSTLDRTDSGPNGDGTGCVEVPYTLTSDTSTVTLLKDQATVVQQGAQFSLTITWGLAAGQYPNYGTTTFDLDGDPNTTTDAFTPVNCTIVNGVAQYPMNPDGSGNYWPAGTAEQPWCLASSTIGPMPGGTDMQVTETFLGSGDPVISRSK